MERFLPRMCLYAGGDGGCVVLSHLESAGYGIELARLGHREAELGCMYLRCRICSSLCDAFRDYDEEALLRPV